MTRTRGPERPEGAAGARPVFDQRFAEPGEPARRAWFAARSAKRWSYADVEGRGRSRELSLAYDTEAVLERLE